MKLQYEITPGQWVKVEPEQLTDDHEETPSTIDPETINGTSWYLDGDYTTAPRMVRVGQ